MFRVDSSGANRARAAAYVLSAGLDSQSPSFNFIVSVFVYGFVSVFVYVFVYGFVISSYTIQGPWSQSRKRTASP